MVILFLALIFGIVALILTARQMKKGMGGKFRSILRVVLLLVEAAYILVFLVVIVKTLFL